jgi:hypothetical protein
MAIYIVHVFFNGDKKYRIEAKDKETAEERAVDRLYDEIPKHIDVVETYSELDDNQYTDQEELYDREEDR